MKTVKCIVNTSFVIAVMLVSLFATVSDIQVQAKTKKVLVVYFTSTGTTEKVAKKSRKRRKELSSGSGQKNLTKKTTLTGPETIARLRKKY